MTSSGSTDVALGNLLKEQVFESRRSPFSELSKEAELWRAPCTVCLNLNRHAVFGSFQQVQIQTGGVRPGLGMTAGSLAPGQLAPG